MKLAIVAFFLSGCFIPDFRKANAEARIAEAYASCLERKTEKPSVDCREARVAYWRGR